MKLTLQAQLFPDESTAARLREAVERFNGAATWLAGVAFEHRCSNKFKLQQIAYKELRERFGIPADMAVRCLSQVCEAYKRDKEVRPEFRKHAAVPYSMGENIGFKGPDRVSLSTLDGRVVVPFVMGRYHRERFGWPKGQCDLVSRADGKWFLLVTVDLPEGTPAPTGDFIGIDLGVINIATGSDGGRMPGEKVEKARRKYGDRRRELQKAATEKRRSGRRPRSIRRKLAKDRAKGSRYKRDVNHCESRRYVDLAKRTGRGLALEDLAGIRDGITARGKDARGRLGGWSFGQFRSFVEYKAKVAGVVVAAVDPAYTSRECAECGHRDRRNRKTQARFRCVKCGHLDHADINAARNIRARAIVMVAQGSERVQVATSQTTR